jgi:two-component system, cell cycle response regulator
MPNLRHRTILIVDDSDAIQHHVERVLTAEADEFQVLMARDGLSAFNLLVRHKVDLVLCDLVMPGIDGFKFLTLKHGRPELADLPVIMLTGASDVSEKVKALEAGAADYLTKPFHERELVARVRVHLKLRALQEELKEKNERLEVLSRMDGLTGIWNRRHVMEVGEVELVRARRYGTELGCIVLDLDHFKRVNDQHGHLVGDRVLAAVAEQLQRDLRRCDLAARYGGEEFVLLLPQTGLEGTRAVAERQRAAVAELCISEDAGEVRPTASFGVAAFPTHPAKAIEELFRHADQALYRAKELGRNRVEVAETIAAP